MTPPQHSAAPRGSDEHPLGVLLAPDILALLEEDPAAGATGVPEPELAGAGPATHGG